MNRATRRAANKTNQKRLPERLSPLSRDQWPSDTDPDRKEVWVSKKYMVQVFEEPLGERLSINRVQATGNSWKEEITWDELQEIKRQVGFGPAWAVEIYPPEDQVVNVSNMRHLWVLEEAPAYGWKRG